MAISVNDIRSIGQIQLSHNWRLDILKQPISNAGFVISKDINLRCKSVEIPSLSYSTQTIKIKQFQIQRNSPSTTKDLSLSFIQTTDNIIYDFFSSWQSSVFDLKTGKSDKRDLISAIISLTLLNNDDSASRLFILYGCILKGYERTKLDSESKEMEANIVLAYDYFKEFRPDLVGLIGVGGDIASLFSDKIPSYLKI